MKSPSLRSRYRKSSASKTHSGRSRKDFEMSTRAKRRIRRRSKIGRTSRGGSKISRAASSRFLTNRRRKKIKGLRSLISYSKIICELYQQLENWRNINSFDSIVREEVFSNPAQQLFSQPLLLPEGLAHMILLVLAIPMLRILVYLSTPPQSAIIQFQHLVRCMELA